MKTKAGVSVEAPPEAIFELLERDRTEFGDDEVAQRERVGDLPFGPGFMMRSRVFHKGQMCSLTHRITECRPPQVFEEEFEHRCANGGTVVKGVQRFEILSDVAGTILLSRFSQHRPGLAGLIEPLFASLCNPARIAAMRLGMRAEALALSRQLAVKSPAGSGTP